MKLILLILFCIQVSYSQTAKEILDKSTQRLGKDHLYNKLQLKMIRPNWTRTVQLKSWSTGRDHLMIYIEQPQRDKGQVYLRTKNEFWNWIPRVNKKLKLPPSMMSQSWMGSDLNNGDLFQNRDYENQFKIGPLSSKSINGKEYHFITLSINKDSDLLYGKVLVWIDKETFLQKQIEFYDEEGKLISTHIGNGVEKLDKFYYWKTLEVLPAEKPGYKTILTTLEIDLNIKKPLSFYSIRNLRSVR